MSRPRLPIAVALLAPLVASATASGQQVAPKTRESVEDVKAANDEPPQDRGKSLQTSVGLPPNSLDLGSEADILGVRDQREMAALLERWSFSMKGSIRAPMRVGFGRRNDGQPGTEMHALPRIVGLGSGDWNYVGLAPNASVTLGIVVANPIVSGTIILGTSHLSDPSYSVIDDVGLDQAYLTFKFPTAFGNRGGISLMTGIFSERYGLSGPYQKSSGYYSTYLFGRTHQAGESLTFDIDLSRKVELILENGIGAKTETVPFFPNDAPQPLGPPEADFFPGQQSQPYGSTFVHHTHAALLYDNWLRLSANYLSSWSPDDNTLQTGAHIPPARLNVIGGDVHVDKELYNVYVGYSHVDANNVYPLSDAVNVLHSGTGRSLKLNYFGQKDRFTGITPSNFSGTIDTVLWQAMLRVAPLLGDPLGSRDMNLAVYGMYNKAKSPKDDPNDPTSIDIDDDKLKFGADLDVSLFKFMSFGTRFDRVMPKMADTSDAYTAISPRVSFYTKWKSKEQAIVQYTHFFLGKNTVPGSPYTDEYFHPDPDMLVVMGRMSF
jgi:hypothetical protein